MLFYTHNNKMTKFIRKSMITITILNISLNIFKKFTCTSGSTFNSFSRLICTPYHFLSNIHIYILGLVFTASSSLIDKSYCEKSSCEENNSYNSYDSSYANDSEENGYDPLIVDENHRSRGSRNGSRSYSTDGSNASNARSSNSSFEKSLLIGGYYEGSMPVNLNGLLKMSYTSNALVLLGYEMKNSDIYMSFVAPIKLLSRKTGFSKDLVQRQLGLEFHVGPMFLNMFALNLIGGATFTSINFKTMRVFGFGSVLGLEFLTSISIFNIFAAYKLYYTKINGRDFLPDNVFCIGVQLCL